MGIKYPIPPTSVCNVSNCISGVLRTFYQSKLVQSTVNFFLTPEIQVRCQSIKIIVCSVFKEKHGVWDPMPKLTITHIVNSVVSYPPPLQRERGGEGQQSSSIG
jgi:hypothetical protein